MRVDTNEAMVYSVRTIDAYGAKTEELKYRSAWWRAKGMAQIAEQTGLSREQLYRSFSEKGNPTLKTTLAVMQALGIELTAKIPSAA